MNERIKRNVLVTGATGFIGSHLCEGLIRKGYNVFGISRSYQIERIKPLLDSKGVFFQKGDIQDLELLYNIINNNSIKAIFHLAAVLPHNNGLDDPFPFFNVNARGTLNLLNAAYLNGVEVFIYASTMSVYSEPSMYLPVDEKHPVQPSTIYGVSKLEGELYCNAYSKKMNITILRYGGAYGQGQHKHNAMFRFITQALNNRPITIYGNGIQTTDFTYIRDIVQATLLAFEESKPGVYNIGSGEEISIRELAERVINLTNSKSEIILTNTSTNRPFRFVLDIIKAREILGYSPFSFNEGLAEYISEFGITDPE